MNVEMHARCLIALSSARQIAVPSCSRSVAELLRAELRSREAKVGHVFRVLDARRMTPTERELCEKTLYYLQYEVSINKLVCIC